jgi:hypothetical protein
MCRAQAALSDCVKPIKILKNKELKNMSVKTGSSKKAVAVATAFAKTFAVCSLILR